MKRINCVFARNATSYAIGRTDAGGQFHVRRVVWGRLMARSEKRDGEQIRRAVIMVESKITLARARPEDRPSPAHCGSEL